MRHAHEFRSSLNDESRADLLRWLLNDDYFSVRDEHIKKIRPLLTVVDGRIVHDADVL